jgi:ComF family protein
MSLSSTLLDLVYPRSCAGCGGKIKEEAGHICWDCFAEMRVIDEPFCTICGDPIHGKVEHKYACGWCLDHRPHFDLARSVVMYRGVAQAAIQALKYANMTCLTTDLVSLLSAGVRSNYLTERLDAVTFVPLYGRRERERTYNQAKLLAKGVADEFGLPLLPKSLRRIKPTPTQTNLSATERRKNVNGAFAAEDGKWLKGRNLLLVDDVMTTGATVDEVSRVLKKAGAAKVFVITVARG